MSVKELLKHILMILQEQSTMPLSTTRTASQTKSISARQGATFAPTAPTVDGYTAVAIVGREQNHGNSVYITSEMAWSTYVFNSASSAQSTTLTHTFLYLRNS